MNLPISLNGEQQSRLHALIMNGSPDLMIVDTPVQGDDLYVLIARGAARRWVIETLTPRVAEAMDELAKHELEGEEEVAPVGPLGAPPPPKKPVISEGVRAAVPGARGPS